MSVQAFSVELCNSSLSTAMVGCLCRSLFPSWNDHRLRQHLCKFLPAGCTYLCSAKIELSEAFQTREGLEGCIGYFPRRDCQFFQCSHTHEMFHTLIIKRTVD